MFPRRRAPQAAILSALLLALAHPAIAQLDEAIGLRTDAQAEGSASQGRIDAMSDETDRMLAQYRTALQRTEALQVYNQQLSELVDSQEEEKRLIRRDIERVTVVNREITPLMLRMIESLDVFIELDVPFLLSERTERVKTLREMMKRPDVSEAEKFRRVLEAFQIENDYGRSIEAYRAELDAGGSVREVEFLRIGRTALYYQTLDGSEMGRWDQTSGRWVPVDASYRAALRQGLRMARKQAAPNLLLLPIAAAEGSG
jgi:hypothetical protein